MERSEIFEKLNEIFCDVLDLDSVDLNDSTSADDIEEWDSLNHVQIVYAVRDTFGVKFSSLEVLKWQNVGDMVDSILKKLS